MATNLVTMTCTEEGCDGQAVARGWCNKHYKRERKRDADWAPRCLPWPDNLLRRLRVDPDGCVRFTGHLVDGYGQVRGPGGRDVGAHIAMYELEVGPVPEGLQLDHLCHDDACPASGGACPHRACCNIEHLAPKTPRENVLRGNTITAAHAAKTHCKWGHPFDEANTYVRPSGGRGCRECRREGHRRRRFLARQGIR